ncbi:bifunctional DNA primase/polymerase [Streptomyces sp. NPDC018031]|uniref:bifunctional DNA primase/polymerase n=1 Tax=Streptomyces sp. NPDC018031 TaxID=3365033 RepID=UPI0037A5E84F
MTKRGMQWLSAAADDPEVCRAAWAGDPRRPVTLSTGRYFDVVVIDQRIGMETFDQLDRQGMPMGPVMVDWGAHQVGFFLPSRSRARFVTMLESEVATPPKYRYLDTGSVVVAPGPMPLSGDRYAWLRAPIRRPEANPSRVAALAAMFVASAALVARADRYGQEQKSLTAAASEAGDSQQGPARA